MIKLLLLAAVALGAAIAGAQTIDDETAIRTIVQDEASAWTHGDATAYSLHFADDGAFTNILGEFSIGHDVFLKHHEFLFQGPYRGTTLHHDIVSLKFPRPDVAVVEVLTSVTGFQKPSTVYAEARRRFSGAAEAQHSHSAHAGCAQNSSKASSGRASQQTGGQPKVAAAQSSATMEHRGSLYNRAKEFAAFATAGKSADA